MMMDTVGDTVGIPSEIPSESFARIPLATERAVQVREMSRMPTVGGTVGTVGATVGGTVGSVGVPLAAPAPATPRAGNYVEGLACVPSEAPSEAPAVQIMRKECPHAGWLAGAAAGQPSVDARPRCARHGREPIDIWPGSASVTSVRSAGDDIVLGVAGIVPTRCSLLVRDIECVSAAARRRRGARRWRARPCGPAGVSRRARATARSRPCTGPRERGTARRSRHRGGRPVSVACHPTDRGASFSIERWTDSPESVSSSPERALTSPRELPDLSPRSP
jgi:hypothetical protein